jgi:hypothetical protein
MDLFDFQTTLTVAVILTATAVVVFFDYLRRHRRNQQPQPINISKPRPHRLTPTFDAAVLDYAPAKRIAAEPSVKPAAKPASAAPVDSLVGVATPFRPDVTPRIERETVTVKMAPASPPASSGSGETSTSSTSLQTFTLPEFTIDAALWERLIASQPKGRLLESAGPVPQAVTPPPPPARALDTIEAGYKMIQDEHLPSDDQLQGELQGQIQGMIHQATLEKWLETEQSFTGLVVSIGINEGDSTMWHSRGFMQSVGNYIAGLLKAKDYCCRTAYDEFLIVCPGDLGAQAHRRLNHISERLWDYQLRGIGACSILFSWGGVPVQNQPLADAVASATERMRETKRSAKSALTHS